MAIRAVSRCENWARARVRRIIRLLPRAQVAAGVAAVVCRDLQMVVVVDMAGLAWHGRMPPGERKADRRRGVVPGERCPKPGIERGVAALAIGGGKNRRVRRMRGIAGVLPVLQVARLAVRRQAVENSASRLLVAVLANHRGVRPQQRKTILVFFHLLNRDVPAPHRMALLAVRAHLPPMHVCVAIGAVLPYVGEHRLGVAQHAFHFFVHAPQRVSGFVVVEFGNRANRFPAGGRVTVFARNSQGAMRTARAALLPLRVTQIVNISRRACPVSGERREQQGPQSDLEYRERKGLLSRRRWHSSRERGSDENVYRVSVLLLAPSTVLKVS
jgi:hypothetical protein